LLAVLALAAFAGCSANEVHSPLAFFPGSEPSSWSDCDKFGTGGNEVRVCATLVIPPTTTKPTAYSISFYLPRTAHVRLTVFDSHAVPVRTLMDQDEPGTVGPYRLPPVVWDFTDSQGRRVPKGDYRCYFSADEFLSFSDVEVP
jgi:hypothetical protein